MPTYLFNWPSTPAPQPLPAVMDYSPLPTAERNATPQELQQWEQSYQRIREVERRFMSRTTVPKGDRKLVHTRIVGYLLLYLPEKTQRSKFVDDLNTHIQLDTNGVVEDGILSMGEYMRKYLFRIFKDAVGPTPVDSQQETLSAYEEIRNELLQNLDQSPKDHKMSKKLALERDGFRCLLTGAYDNGSAMAFQKYTEHVQRAAQEAAPGQTPQYPRRLSTHLCHIISECMNTQIDDPTPSGYLKANSASHMWNLLKMFGYARLEDLNGHLIHRLENVLTLTRELHGSMDKLELWFEYTGAVNKYKVCMTDPGITFFDLPDYVTFRNEASNLPTRSSVSRAGKGVRDPFPLPNHRYLDLHAICCRVARMSGGADVIDEIERDIEETRVLSSDGADAHLLDYKLVGLDTHSGMVPPVH